MTDEPVTTSEMPFLDHLEELRWRLVKSIAALMVTFGISFTFCMSGKFDVIALLIKPIEPFLNGSSLIYTHPMDPFSILLKIAVGLGLVLASPVIAFQIWAFLSPALMPRERRVLVPVLVAAAGLFLAGISVSVFVFVPVTMSLIAQIQTSALRQMLSVDDYFGFLFSISLAFGALFELPILILALTALGLVTPSFLAKYRRHAFVICLVVCEVITPGDAVISTLILFVPVYGLYEVSIIVSWFVYHARVKRQKASAALGESVA